MLLRLNLSEATIPYFRNAKKSRASFISQSLAEPLLGTQVTVQENDRELRLAFSN